MNKVQNNLKDKKNLKKQLDKAKFNKIKIVNHLYKINPMSNWLIFNKKNKTNNKLQKIIKIKNTLTQTKIMIIFIRIK